MYPNLIVPLAVSVALLVGVVLIIGVRQPVSRRLALRQLSRRLSEAGLAVIGSTLGTAIIVGALVVGDTLNFSVRQDAYRTLGPIDERVVSANATVGDAVSRSLAQLAADQNIDGVLDARFSQAAAVTQNVPPAAEPQVLVWEMDLDAAHRFGSAGGSSGLTGPTPSTGQVVINQPLADALHAHVGQGITLYLYGTPVTLTIGRIVAQSGVAGAGLGAGVNRNAFLPAGLLTEVAKAAGTTPRAVTFVSNRGGVEAGAALTDQVTGAIRRSLGPLGATSLVDTPKRAVLDAAQKVGDTLGALFLMIGSFSIIAGALLLVNIFVMLADERKGQLGMLRAIGMKRSRLIGSFTVEGATYAFASIVPGILLGLAVGWAVARVAAVIFRSFSANGEGLDISFAVTPTSLWNGSAMGLVISLITIIVTSVRISRINIIAAIRDLPTVVAATARRRFALAGAALALLFSIPSVQAISASQAEGSYLYPSLAAASLFPVLRRRLTARSATNVLAFPVLLWCLVAPLLRPHLFDSPSMAVYVIQGSLVAFSSVALISQNQTVVLRPVRALLRKPSETSLALHLAIAYPLAKRFRTGAVLVMYTLIMLVLVLLVEIAGVINASVDHSVAEATAGYGLRLDFNPNDANRIVAELNGPDEKATVQSAVVLTSASAFASDPGHRTNEPVHSVVVGTPDNALAGMSLTSRLPQTPTDAAVWALLTTDSRYVVMDQFFGTTGGPNTRTYVPGDTFTLTDPRSGRVEQKTIAGILANAMMFYPRSGTTANAFPILAGVGAVNAQFGTAAEQNTALIRLQPGGDPQQLADRLQAKYLSASLVATPIAAAVRRMFSANIAFFRLMQGFLGLGLLIGITGLGVVMIRAVRERRRTIGVLRALGFQAATIERSFLLESGLIALQGVLLGSVLGVLTTWLMYEKSAAFEGARVAFPIEWSTVSLLAIATVLASLAATVAPARRAARIKPAIAVRVAD